MELAGHLGLSQSRGDIETSNITNDEVMSSQPGGQLILETPVMIRSASRSKNGRMTYDGQLPCKICCLVMVEDKLQKRKPQEEIDGEVNMRHEQRSGWISMAKILLPSRVD